MSRVLYTLGSAVHTISHAVCSSIVAHSPSNMSSVGLMCSESGTVNRNLIAARLIGNTFRSLGSAASACCLALFVGSTWK